MHHLLEELGEGSGGLTHEVLDLISQFLIHVPLKLVDVQGSSIVLNDVFAVISLIKHQLEFCQVTASNERSVLFLSKETLGKGSHAGLGVPVSDVECVHFHAKHF